MRPAWPTVEAEGRGGKAFVGRGRGLWVEGGYSHLPVPIKVHRFYWFTVCSRCAVIKAPPPGTPGGAAKAKHFCSILTAIMLCYEGPLDVVSLSYLPAVVEVRGNAGGTPFLGPKNCWREFPGPHSAQPKF